LPQIADSTFVRSRLEKDLPWTAYALADLEPGHVEHASWFCADDGSGLVLLYREFPRPIVFCIERSKHLASILREIDRVLCCGNPPQPNNSADREIVIRPDDTPLLRSMYRIADERPMFRMILDSHCFQPVPFGNAIRLSLAHLSTVHELYGNDTPEFFYDRMLNEGIYFGVFEGADLAAIAGTHIVSPRFGVAAIGNVFTRTNYRRRGYAGITTSAVSQALHNAGITTIVLNVLEENSAAARIYERLGYRRYCRYLELNAAPYSLV
jgi:RimJ/RimL family protein N-acetyltransferase